MHRTSRYDHRILGPSASKGMKQIGRMSGSDLLLGRAPFSSVLSCSVASVPQKNTDPRGLMVSIQPIALGSLCLALFEFDQTSDRWKGRTV